MVVPEPAKAEPLHRLPCQIKFTGAAELEKYFPINDDAAKASFRGKALVASKLESSQHQSFYVALSEEHDGNRWNLVGKRTSLIQWHHDNVDAGIQEAISKASKYIQFTEAIL